MNADLSVAGLMLVGGGGLLGGLWFLARWAWTHTQERIKEVAKEAAEKEQRDRERFEKIEQKDRERYERLLVATTDSAAGVKLLTDLYKDSRARHEDLLTSTTRIATQVEYLTGMIQSEKGTNARAHSEMFAHFDKIEERINKLNERRSEPRP